MNRSRSYFLLTPMRYITRYLLEVFGASLFLPHDERQTHDGR